MYTPPITLSLSLNSLHPHLRISPPLLTCPSGSSPPRVAAPTFTTSASLVIVATADCAASANFSWLEAAPETSVLVSSTKALAVFKMLSLWIDHNKGNKMRDRNLSIALLVMQTCIYEYTVYKWVDNYTILKNNTLPMHGTWHKNAVQTMKKTLRFYMRSHLPSARC